MSFNIQYTNQITIVHFSDLHFGSHHICNPEASASGDGIPKLADLVCKDLSSNFGATFGKDEPPVVVAVTGDFTQKADQIEFEQASNFLNKIVENKILNQIVHKSDIFMIPGNHDVVFTKPTSEERFQPYANFYNKFYSKVRQPIFSNEALSFTQIHKINKGNNKILVAEINCCMYVENDTVDASRGQVAIEAITKLRKELLNFKKDSDFNDYIKIVLIHHHVVLLPSFIESGRGVDSVVHARHLLELLSEYDFHVILHGHKHYPHIFSYDPLPLWNENEAKIPQLVIAGSCGSSELPNTTSACNTYGVIQIKWHPNAKQSRVKIITRGLKIKGKTGLLTPDVWEWETVNVSEKILSPYHSLPTTKESKFSNGTNDERKEYYQKLRGQMPIVEVMPSLIPGQAYEARVWITPHGDPLTEDKELLTVEWSAGVMFAVQTANKETNSNFCIAYHYWGPMLIQAKLTFKDGYEAIGFVYARMPKNEI